jgi:hypothetical protein
MWVGKDLEEGSRETYNLLFQNVVEVWRFLTMVRYNV